ncbi:MAG: SMI1/KNR4 family protein [Pseudobutyrivibrio sp.]|nr:SMI1/KNR4 family protein [Pseudobutyrivibrio sp.]
MYKELSVPENDLKDVITELLEYCDEKEEEGELGKTKFSSPVSEEEIENWEKENGVRIPESYKQWLRFTGDCIIDGTTAEFYSPKNFRTQYVPDDLVIIGEQTGDGEGVCFSKETGEIVTFFEGEINFEYGTFDEALKEILSLMGKEEETEEEYIQELKSTIANLKSKLDGSELDDIRLNYIKDLEEELEELEG